MERVRLNKSDPYESIRLVRIGKIAELTGFNRWSIIRWVKAGKFPKPIHIGKTTHAWRLSDVQAWLKAREGSQP